ncbi:hypothetical protein ACDL92_09945 [Ihubacter sp. mB4P-1]|uniref:hypothetical protein n=1 Tax=Ihubacter sp. mB4P-1 TaxID=3242370 RepID=UPI003C79BD9B
MMFAIIKVIFWAGWLVLIFAVLAVRLGIAVLKLLYKGVCYLFNKRTEKAKGYEVRYYG